MKVRFQLINVGCVVPLKSDRDALKIHFVAASESGDLDKVESDSETSIGNPLITGPFELNAGDTLECSLHPPIGRQDWLTNPIDFGETSKVRFDIVGLGLHKAELGGGSDPSSTYTQIITAVRDKLTSLIPYVGDVVVKLLNFSETVANADPDKNCLGPVFAFNKEFDGSDLIIDLIKSAYSGEAIFVPTDSSAKSASGCNTPLYTAMVRMHLQGQIRFGAKQTTRHSGNGQQFELKNLKAACRQSSPVMVWASRQTTIYELTPNTLFSVLRYVWDINGTEINEGSGSVAVKTKVSRINASDPYADDIFVEENVTLEYAIDRDGLLKLNCPATAGNFNLKIACRLRNDHNSVSVYGTNLSIISEVLEGNAAFSAYSGCVRTMALTHIRDLLSVAQLVRRLPTDPSPVEAVRHFDDWAKIGTNANTLKRGIDVISLKSSFKKPNF